MKEEITTGDLHPRDAKMLLAKTIVRMYHGIEQAESAEKDFIDVFQKGSMPSEIPTIRWDGESKISLIDLLLRLNMVQSKSEARRMIENKGVRVNGEKVEETHLTLTITDGLVIQVGKRKFLQILF